MEDTIAAISTPVGEGGIGIIRVSGPRAFDIADQIFFSRRGKPSSFPTHTIHFGTIRSNGNLIDQVMLTVMRAPKTYTTEDVIEINCHGGLLTARKILSCCLEAGARLAEPGEFTKRAFLNGRIDLTQAEGVMDLIRARTDRAQAAAARALEGHLAKQVNLIRDDLLTLLAHVEAHIDFPEDDIAPDTNAELRGKLDGILNSLRRLLSTAREGKILREGISVAIVGRPNVGKSSLMNALLGQERSIVTPIPGTTRDTIEECTNIRGILIRFIDTAGIRIARGTVEHLGVLRSRKTLATSDLVIRLVDSSRPYTKADAEIRFAIGSTPTISVLSKIDLPSRAKLPTNEDSSDFIEVSAVTGKGLDELRDLILKISCSGQVGASDIDVAINERHAETIRRSLESLSEAKFALAAGTALDLVAQPLRIGLHAIGEIVGKTTTEDILERIFGTFCIGK